MTDIQSINKKIAALQKELDTMRGDEAELNRLHTEKAGALDAMRSGKSRDFAGMAALEGQRAALDTMLREQRAEMAPITAQIAELEARKVRAGQLAQVGAHVERVTAYRRETEEALEALGGAVRAALDRVLNAREGWHNARRAALEEAASQFSLSYPVGFSQTAENNRRMEDWATLFADLQEEGFDGQALRASPCVPMRGDQFSFTSHWEEGVSPGELDYMRHRLGHALPRPVLRALADAVSEAESAQPHDLRGVM